jgi:hypothetical protein
VQLQKAYDNLTIVFSIILSWNTNISLVTWYIKWFPDDDSSMSPHLSLSKLTSISRLPGTGEYNKFYGGGVYNCAGCGTPLYKSTTKFDSGCGWPAFFEGLPGAINRTVWLSIQLLHVSHILGFFDDILMTCFYSMLLAWSWW